MGTTTPIRLRRMTEADLGFGLALSGAVGWNQAAADWLHFLETRPEGAFVALVDEQRAGTVATLRHRTARGAWRGWIGMLLVHAEFRGRGVGSRLLDAAIGSLADAAIIELDATPAGRSLYVRRGFVASFPLTRLVVSRADLAQGPADAILTPRRLEPRDLEAVATLDASRTGVARGELLASLAQRAPTAAHVLEAEDGTIQGFVLGRDGTRHHQVGPVVAANVDQARSLVGAALTGCGRSSVVIDAWASPLDWTARLFASGFVAERPLLRMRRGPESLASRPTWAIAGPELG